jgi:hypothetical protein
MDDIPVTHELFVLVPKSNEDRNAGKPVNSKLMTLIVQ